jgi:predicted DNA-binding antitoxin AbrB/MazE fold protein
MRTNRAIYDRGLFRPIEPVDLPEGSPVELEPRLISEPTSHGHRARFHDLLSRTIETGDPDMASGHDVTSRPG